MKKLFAILLIVALVLVLGACNSSPSDPQPSGTDTPVWHGGVLDLDDPYYADGLNDYGLPDLSMYTIEQICDMYFHPEKWNMSVLNVSDSSFDFDESESYSDPEIAPDYIFGFGEWLDYDPGNWTPGPDEISQFDIDWSEIDSGNGEYDPSILVLPEKYAFLVPGGVRSGDMVVNDEDGLNISLSNRTNEEYEAIVQAAKDGGYTINPSTGAWGGMQYYTAENGTEDISIAYRNNSVTITVDDIKEEGFDEGADED